MHSHKSFCYRGAEFLREVACGIRIGLEWGWIGLVGFKLGLNGVSGVEYG